MTVKLFIPEDETGAKTIKRITVVDPMGIEANSRFGAGDRCGKNQMPSRFQNPDHFPHRFLVGVEIDFIAISTQAKVLQGAKGQDQIERLVGQVKILGVPGENRFVDKERTAVPHIHSRYRVMG